MFLTLGMHYPLNLCNQFALYYLISDFHYLWWGNCGLVWNLSGCSTGTRLECTFLKWLYSFVKQGQAVFVHLLGHHYSCLQFTIVLRML